jgi:hypothetical protein
MLREQCLLHRDCGMSKRSMLEQKSKSSPVNLPGFNLCPDAHQICNADVRALQEEARAANVRLPYESGEVAFEVEGTDVVFTPSTLAAAQEEERAHSEHLERVARANAATPAGATPIRDWPVDPTRAVTGDAAPELPLLRLPGVAWEESPEELATYDNGTIVFTDVNPVVGLEPAGPLFQQAAAVGVSHAALLRGFLSNALVRAGRPRLPPPPEAMPLDPMSAAQIDEFPELLNIVSGPVPAREGGQLNVEQRDRFEIPEESQELVDRQRALQQQEWLRWQNPSLKLVRDENGEVVMGDDGKPVEETEETRAAAVEQDAEEYDAEFAAWYAEFEALLKAREEEEAKSAEADRDAAESAAAQAGARAEEEAVPSADAAEEGEIEHEDEEEVEPEPEELALQLAAIMAERTQRLEQGESDPEASTDGAEAPEAEVEAEAEAGEAPPAPEVPMRELADIGVSGYVPGADGVGSVFSTHAQQKAQQNGAAPASRPEAAGDNGADGVAGSAEGDLQAAGESAAARRDGGASATPSGSAIDGGLLAARSRLRRGHRWPLGFLPQVAPLHSGDAARGQPGTRRGERLRAHALSSDGGSAGEDPPWFIDEQDGISGSEAEDAMIEQAIADLDAEVAGEGGTAAPEPDVECQAAPPEATAASGPAEPSSTFEDELTEQDIEQILDELQDVNGDAEPEAASTAEGPSVRGEAISAQARERSSGESSSSAAAAADDDDVPEAASTDAAPPPMPSIADIVTHMRWPSELRQKVYVLAGGDAAQRQGSLASGLATYLHLQTFPDLEVTLFVVHPLFAGAHERTRRQEILARRMHLLELGVAPDQLSNELSLGSAVRPMTSITIPPPPLDDRMVWAVPHALALRRSVEDVVEACEAMAEARSASVHARSLAATEDRNLLLQARPARFLRSFLVSAVRGYVQYYSSAVVWS